MRGEIKTEGKYELFRTTEEHTILNLNNELFFALVEGQKGEIIVKSDSDHKKKETIAEGNFHYIDFENDPEFQDMPHLFLKDNKEYRELILPEGLPDNQDKQKKLVRTEKKLKESTVWQQVKGRGNKGDEKQYSDKAEGLRTKTKEELYDLAQKYKIEGRSDMNKDELAQALEEKINY